MRETLERAANAVLRSNIPVYCDQCDEPTYKCVDNYEYIINAFKEEFLDYNFIWNGVSKIIVLEL